MSAATRAHALLDWNRRHLTHAALVSEDEIGQCFAPRFVVHANGRHYDADLSSYQRFLDGFRSTIETIDYTVQHEVTEEDAAALALQARIRRIGGELESYDALLLLRFDSNGKVVLWHEVYVPTGVGGGVPEAGAPAQREEATRHRST